MAEHWSDLVPRWASPPGETITEALVASGMTKPDFVDATGLSDEIVAGLLAGSIRISIGMARRLSEVIGGSVEFWISRDGQYRDDLERVEADAWAASMPTAAMSSLGWIERPDGWHERIATCLHFFGVKDVADYRARYESVVHGARFRTRGLSDLDEGATAAWLRKSEVEALEIECRQWDIDRFASALDQIRPLTRMSDPRRFMPMLVATCARAGVAVTLVRLPRGCIASGAARRLPSGRPHIALSARYRSDDHLWFTFMHEAAHLLRHSPDRLYVDDIEPKSGDPSAGEEREADEFAAEQLLPRQLRPPHTRSGPSPKHVHQIAKEAGVSPGIVVGQLQHDGVISFRSPLNALKRRYVWAGSTLEKA